MEKLKIENFGGIKEMELEIKPITILIGPQGAGKSIVAKLLYFFKSFVSIAQDAVNDGLSESDLDTKLEDQFTVYFPKESWPESRFKITYTVDSSYIFVEKDDEKFKLEYSESYRELLTKGVNILAEETDLLNDDFKNRDFKLHLNLKRRFFEIARKEIALRASYDQYFVPAGRSFFAHIQNTVFSFINENRSLDPFLREFGLFYSTIRQFYLARPKDKEVNKEIDRLFSGIMNSAYVRENDNDFLVHEDGRRVNIANASSGQQEMLPLMIILKTFNLTQISRYGSTLYIEEPEAHLFPTAQKSIVQLLARTFNYAFPDFQIVITTHSPYILSSFNNLLEAGKILEEKPETEDKLIKIIPRKEMISPDVLVGYSIQEGKCNKIVDRDTKLISQTILDSVSNEIADEFDKLLDIEF